MRFSTLSIVTFVLFFALSACKQKDNSVPCPTLMPAVENLRFRLVDQAGKDLLADTTHSPYYWPASITASQPCNGSYMAPSKYVVYRKPGEGDNACCFWFPSLQNPSTDAGTDCFQVVLHWDNRDTDTLQWAYYVDELDPCKPQMMLSVSFNGTVLTGPTYDGAYQYYLLRK